MKRLLLIFAFTLIIGTGTMFADDIGIPFSVDITSTAASVNNGSCRIDEFYIVNSSNVAQTVYFYDNDVEKWRIFVAASSDKDVHLNTPIKFFTNCTAKSQDTYGNNKVRVQGVKQ